MKSLEISLISFLFGVAGYFIGIWFLFVSVMLLIGLSFYFKKKVFIVLGIIVLGFGFFLARNYVLIHQSRIPQSSFNSKQEFTGIVSGDPDLGLTSTTIVLELDSGDHIQVSFPAHTNVSYGDSVSVVGTLHTPQSFMTDTGREFDYPTYLLVHGIAATMSTKNIQVLDHHEKSRFVEDLFLVKKYFTNEVQKLFPSPENGLFAGIVIGEQSLLPKTNLTEFQIAGLTHMIVLSGYNITVVALGAMWILVMVGFGYRARRIGAIVAIPIFIIMTGMGASSVRAGIMAIIVFLLQLDTRPAHSFRIILLTLSIMVAINPYALLYDPSLHLSFLAFIGLVYVTPITEFLFQKYNVAEWGGMRDLLIETLSVQLFVLPYIIWMSGRVSLLILISNLITVPLTPLVMGAGFTVTLLGMIVNPIGVILAKPISWIMTYMLSVAHIVASIRATTFTLPPFGGWVMVGIYTIMTSLIAVFLKKINNNKI